MTTVEMISALDALKAELLHRLDSEKRAPEDRRLSRVTQIVRRSPAEAPKRPPAAEG